MIADTSGMYALFENQDDENKKYRSAIQKVVGWTPKGDSVCALVVDVWDSGIVPISVTEFMEKRNVSFVGYLCAAQLESLVSFYTNRATDLEKQDYDSVFCLNGRACPYYRFVRVK